MSFGDGQGEFAFGVVAVAEADDGPGVDDGDRAEVGQGVGVVGAAAGVVAAGVVGLLGELGEVLAQAPGPPDEAESGEGDRVGAGV